MANDTRSSSKDAKIATKFSLQLITHVSTVTKTSKRSKSQLKTRKEVTTKGNEFYLSRIKLYFVPTGHPFEMQP
jgi:hypothetical protein